jgi:hypothetical protein
MKQDWTVDEIIGHFTLLEEEQEFGKVGAMEQKIGLSKVLAL